jgi:tRNA A-37 threonylcarbamoyl transferase component Bud32
VWTKTDLDALLGEKSYQSFIETCLSTFTMLFVGVSADDRSVGGHLERLASLDIETGPHFWLTDRRDYETDSWAEKAGIRLIRYDQQNDHSEVQEFFADLASFVPEDPEDAFAPVAPEGPLVEATEELPSPTEILTWDAERIREALNARALAILNGEDKADYEAYDAFCNKFDQAIYRAWYTNTDTDSNLLLGYTLNREVAQGSFGRVYSATDPNGEVVAVKVLLEEVRRNPDLLRSFRRGVRSMRILHEREVSGMVAYLATSEIPAFVVMEWVDGPNLAEATQAGYLKKWPDLLKASVELAHTVRRAHELPERVLHRDLRPSNVMLSGYFHDSEAWRVVVLDFDLSWHRGAYEQSVVHTSAAGYLAPEQMRPIKNVSTRNSAVDSFGLGMTLLYLCSGQDPSPAQHLHRDWEDEVRKACRRIGGKEWRSAAERFARLILAATRDRQAARWDMAEITGELDRLMEAVGDPSGVTSAELVAEEVAARSEVMSDYSWDADQVRAIQVFPTGMQLAVATELETQSVRLQIEWASTGTEERGNLDKYIVNASKAAAEQLKSFGWSYVKEVVQQRSVQLEASLDAFEVRTRLDEVAESIDRATGKLRGLGSRSA